MTTTTTTTTTIHVIHAELHDVLPLLRSAPIASVITDPPYSAHVHSSAVSTGSAGRGPVDRDLGFAPIDLALRADIATLANHASRWTAIFTDIESVHLWIASLSAIDYVRTTPWVRWSQPQISGDRPPSGCEMIVTAHSSGRKHWSGPGGLTQYRAKALRGADKFSTEKPLDLMLDLVSFFSDRGELVVDPCAGSGTTGLACRVLGRDAVLVERDPTTARLAQTRCTAPLSDRDRDRVIRWIDSQETWLCLDPPDSAAGRARYARGQADVEMARIALVQS